MFFKSFFLSLFFLCVVNVSSAQKKQLGNWLIYFGNQKINRRWNWHNEIQYRNYNFLGDINQLLLRTGIGYNLSENNNNILLGYGFIRSHPYDAVGNKGRVDEHRIFQQFISKQAIQTYYLQHRFRVEERFFAEDFKVRFRYFLSVNKPLNTADLKAKTLYLSAYNEIFLNTTGAAFDRNRLYGGVGYFIKNYIKLELGLMSQMLEKGSRSQFQIIIFNNFPLSN